MRSEERGERREKREERGERSEKREVRSEYFFSNDPNAPNDPILTPQKNCAPRSEERSSCNAIVVI